MKGVGIKMRKVLSGLGHQKGVRFELLALGILSLILYVFPFVSYSYRKVTYTISGWESLFGKVVISGKVNIVPSIWLIGLMVSCLFLIIFGLISAEIRIKLVGTLLLILGGIQIVFNIIAINGIKSQLDKASSVTASYGSLILIAVSFMVVIRGLLILKEAKVLSALDFMVLPGLVYILINNYIPMAGILIAFKKVDYSLGIFASPWVGLENFKYLFATNDAFIITRNTLLYNIAFIIIGNVMGIIVAIALAEIFSKRLQKFFQTSILLPHMISMVIVAYIVFGFLSNQSGWINNTFLTDETSINFYQRKEFWPLILTFVNTWKILGYSSIIYLSSVVGIDRSIYEASYVDGCGRFRQIINITLPLIKPTIITMVLLQAGRIFYSDFGLFYQVPMNSGTLFSVTQTIDTYVYRSLMLSNNISMASAAGAYQSVVGFCFVLFVNYVVRKLDKENALF